MSLGCNPLKNRSFGSFRQFIEHLVCIPQFNVSNENLRHNFSSKLIFISHMTLLHSQFMNTSIVVCVFSETWPIKKCVNPRFPWLESMKTKPLNNDLRMINGNSYLESMNNWWILEFFSSEIALHSLSLSLPNIGLLK